MYLHEWSAGSWLHHVRSVAHFYESIGTGYTAIVETVLPLAVTTRAYEQTSRTFMYVTKAMSDLAGCHGDQPFCAYLPMIV